VGGRKAASRRRPSCHTGQGVGEVECAIEPLPGATLFRMPTVPGICDQCGAVFFSPNISFGTGGTVITAGTRVGPCPHCGSMGSVPDGMYQAFGETLQILAKTPSSAASLQHLAAVLRSARELGKDREATADAIEKEAPEFAGLAGGLREVKGWTVYQWLSLLLLLIGILISHYANSGTPSEFTPQQVEQLFSEFAQGHAVLAPSRQESSPSPPARTQPPVVHPNDPCQCGSGNRYRHCHGRAALRGG
jgi:SEC-C motif